MTAMGTVLLVTGICVEVLGQAVTAISIRTTWRANALGSR